MKSRFFDEEVKIESKYNIIPQDIQDNQKNICIGCDYRRSRLQYDLAEDEARRKGGSPRIYLGGYWMKDSPACALERCLVSTFVLRRWVKAP